MYLTAFSGSSSILRQPEISQFQPSTYSIMGFALTRAVPQGKDSVLFPSISYAVTTGIFLRYERISSFVSAISSAP